MLSCLSPRMVERERERERLSPWIVMAVAATGMVLAEHPAWLWTVYFDLNLLCFSWCHSVRSVLLSAFDR